LRQYFLATDIISTERKLAPLSSDFSDFENGLNEILQGLTLFCQALFWKNVFCRIKVKLPLNDNIKFGKRRKSRKSKHSSKKRLGPSFKCDYQLFLAHF